MKYPFGVIAIILSATLLTVLAPAATQAETKADGYIRINYDPKASGDQGLLLRMVTSLLHSERLQLEAMSKASGLSIDEIKAIAKEKKSDLPGIGYLQEGQSLGFSSKPPSSLLPHYAAAPELTSTGWLAKTVTKSSEERIPADRFVAEFCKLIERELEGVHRTSSDEFDEARVVAADEVETTESEIEKLQSVRARTEQRVGVSHEHLQDRLQKLVSDRQQIAVDQHGLEARRKALTEQIVRLSDRLEEKVDDDPVVNQLQAVVKAREAKLLVVREQFKVATITQGAIFKAESEVALARAELEKYRRDAARTAGGDRLGELNAMLTQTIVDLAEAEARLEFLDGELIPTAHQAVAVTENLEELAFKTDLARQRLAIATERRDAIRREARERRSPKVTSLAT